MKAKVVAALVKPYETKQQALQEIAKTLRLDYPDPAQSEPIIKEAQAIYRANFFPEVKLDWRTHPDFTGHKNWNGCFRCHAGRSEISTEAGERGIRSQGRDLFLRPASSVLCRALVPDLRDHDDVKQGHQFAPRDHRTFRPPGWVEAGAEKIDRMRAIAEVHGLTMLQLACIWNLEHAPVQSVVPTLIQEPGANAKRIETKVEELASLPEVTLTADECAQIAEIGDNTNCMSLKGGSAEHRGDSLPDRWELNDELEAVAGRWKIDPVRDLTNAMLARSRR